MLSLWENQGNKSLIGSADMRIHCDIKDGFNHYKLVYSEYLLHVAARGALYFVGEDHSDHYEQDHSNNLEQIYPWSM